LSYLTAYKRLRVGEASAIAVFQTVFLMVVLSFYLRLLQGQSKEE